MEQLRHWAVTQRSSRFASLFAIIAVVVSFALRYSLDSSLPPGFPFLTFFPAVILTGFFAGTRAGIVVAALCGMVAWYFFLGPVGALSLSAPTIIALLFYVFISATDLTLIHVMRVSLKRLAAEKVRSDQLAQANKLMFHELQHRVSNNLQVVASLLKMQQRNLTDEAAKAALNSASSRLRVISTIQRQLHNPKRQSTDIGQLLREVLPEVAQSAGNSDPIALEFDTQPLVVSGDQATPLALIVVELVSNSIEHAKPDHEPARVHLTTRSDGVTATVIVTDNGKGLPPGFAPEKARSLGLRIAHQFSDQLGGTLTFANHTAGAGSALTGTTVTLRFPLTHSTA